MHVPKTKLQRKKKTVLWGTITWSEMGKQNLQAKTSINFPYYFASGISASVTLPANIYYPTKLLMSSWMYTLLGCLHAHFAAYNIFFLILYTVVHISSCF